MPNEESWNNLDLSRSASIVTTHQEHVNAIAIGDDGGGPCIVIATDGSFLTVIQWRRKPEENNCVKVEGINIVNSETNDGFGEANGLKTETSDGLTAMENIGMATCQNRSVELKTKQNICVKSMESDVMNIGRNDDLKTGENDKSETGKSNSLEMRVSNIEKGGKNSVEKTTESSGKIRGILVLKGEVLDSIDVQRWENDMQFAQVNREDDNT